MQLRKVALALALIAGVFDYAAAQTQDVNTLSASSGTTRTSKFLRTDSSPHATQETVANILGLIQQSDLPFLGPLALASAGTGCTLTGGVLSCPGTPYTLPAAGTGALGGVYASTAAAHQWVSYIAPGGQQVFAQPAFPDIAGLVAYGQLPVGTGASQVYPGNNPSGFVTTAQAAAAAPVQTVAGRSGAVTLGTADIAGFGTAAAAAAPVQTVAGRSGAVSLAASDISGLTAAAAAAAPVQSVAGLTGSPTATQVKTNLAIANTDVSGLGALATAGPGAGCSIVNGLFTCSGTGSYTLPAAAPAALGGIYSVTPAAHQWVTYINTSGNQVLAQPTAADISGLAAAAAAAAPVQSVAGLTGSPTAAQTKTALAIAPGDVSGFTAAAAAAAPVQTVAGRSGAVALAAGDISGLTAAAAAAAPVQTVAGRSGAVALSATDISGLAAAAAAASPVQSVAGLTGAPTAAQTKSALAIGAGDVAGLGSLALAGPGSGCTVTGGLLTCSGSGVANYTAPAHQFFNAITGGTITAAQPAMSDITPGALDSSTVFGQSLANRFSDEIRFLDYGARCDGTLHLLSTDFATLAAAQAKYPAATALTQDEDWAAIQQGFNVGRTNGRAHFLFPPGLKCVVATTINATGLTGLGSYFIEAHGNTLQGQTAGFPIIEAEESIYFHWSGGEITGSGSTPPTWGMVIGSFNSAATGSQGHGSVDNLVFDGKFSQGAVLDEHAEGMKWTFDKFDNTYTSTTAASLVMDGINHFGNTPLAYETNSNTIDVQYSFNENNFDTCVFNNQGGGPMIWMAGTARHRYETGYIYGGSNVTPGVVFYTPSGGAKNQSLFFDVHFETTSLSSEFFFTGPNNNPQMGNFTYIDQQPQASGYIFATDTNIASVTLQNPTISALSPTTGALMFQNPTNWSLIGGSVFTLKPSIYNLTATQAPCTTTNINGVFTGENLSCLTGALLASQLPANVNPVSPVGGLSAGGTSLATATLLTGTHNELDGCASGAFALPTAMKTVWAFNRSGVACSIYPDSTGDNIEGYAAGVPIVIPNGADFQFVHMTATQWDR